MARQWQLLGASAPIVPRQYGSQSGRDHHSRPALTLQELVDHLTSLTTNSLPLALAHITLHSGSDQGLGLLSGSRLSDIITALAVFGTRYDEERWLTFLRQLEAIPGCTELEAQWLVSYPSPVDSPLPAPQSQNKRKASHSGGPEPRHMKRSAAGLNTPVRRSPRCHHTLMTEPTVVHDTEAPSPLAASHQSHRPQLSQAFRRLYGTVPEAQGHNSWPCYSQTVL